MFKGGWLLRYSVPYIPVGSNDSIINFQNPTLMKKQKLKLEDISKQPTTVVLSTSETKKVKGGAGSEAEAFIVIDDIDGF